MTPSAVLIHVPDVAVGLDWYRKAFPDSVLLHINETNHVVLDVNGFSIEIVQEDSKVGSGKRGTVLYWSVASLTDTIAHLLAAGAKLYRGPIEIENNLSMCQVEDPFGNLIGLRGNAA